MSIDHRPTPEEQELIGYDDEGLRPPCPREAMCPKCTPYWDRVDTLLRDDIIKFVSENQPCWPGHVLRAVSVLHPETDVGYEILKMLNQEDGSRVLEMDLDGKIVIGRPK